MRDLLKTKFKKLKGTVYVNSIDPQCKELYVYLRGRTFQTFL